MQCRRKKGKDDTHDDVAKPKKFGDQFTADHAIIGSEDASVDQDTVALIVLDRWSDFIDAFPATHKNATCTQLGLQEYIGLGPKPTLVYSDGSKEIDKALKELVITHDTSTPYRPQTNGVIERSVRRVKEGTTCVLVQSGLDPAWWH